MELRVLNYFLAVAREENFTRAAEQLHVTQPTLSRQISDLEEELGVKLFTRGSHNIVLTEDGMLLKRRAQELLALADRTKRDFLYKEDQLEGTVMIGSGEFLATSILTDCTAAFRKKYPQVRYEFYSGNGENIRENIERGLLDLGLVTEPVDIRKYDFVSMPVHEQWGALVREDSPLAQKSSINSEDLVGIPLVSAVSNLTQSRIGRWFGPLLDQIDVIATGNLLYNEALLARSNIGAVIGIRLDCHYDGLRFVPFSPVLEHTTAVIWKKDQIFSSATAAFIEFVKKYITGISENDK